MTEVAAGAAGVAAAAVAAAVVGEIDCIRRVHFPNNFEENLKNFQSIDPGLESGYHCCCSSGSCSTGSGQRPAVVQTDLLLPQPGFGVGVVEPSSA